MVFLLTLINKSSGQPCGISTFNVCSRHILVRCDFIIYYSIIIDYYLLFFHFYLLFFIYPYFPIEYAFYFIELVSKPDKNMHGTYY